jgi:hypothetical protein
MTLTIALDLPAKILEHLENRPSVTLVSHIFTEGDPGSGHPVLMPIKKNK